MAGQSLSDVSSLAHHCAEFRNSPEMPASTTAEMTASLLHFFSFRMDWLDLLWQENVPLGLLSAALSSILWSRGWNLHFMPADKWV